MKNIVLIIIAMVLFGVAEKQYCGYATPDADELKYFRTVEEVNKYIGGMGFPVRKFPDFVRVFKMEQLEIKQRANRPWTANDLWFVEPPKGGVR